MNKNEGCRFRGGPLFFFFARKRAKKTVSGQARHRTAVLPKSAARLLVKPAFRPLRGRNAQAGTLVPVRLAYEADGASRHLVARCARDAWGLPPPATPAAASSARRAQTGTPCPPVSPKARLAARRARCLRLRGAARHGGKIPGKNKPDCRLRGSPARCPSSTIYRLSDAPGSTRLLCSATEFTPLAVMPEDNDTSACQNRFMLRTQPIDADAHLESIALISAHIPSFSL